MANLTDSCATLIVAEPTPRTSELPLLSISLGGALVRAPTPPPPMNALVNLVWRGLHLDARVVYIESAGVHERVLGVRFVLSHERCEEITARLAATAKGCVRAADVGDLAAFCRAHPHPFLVSLERDARLYGLAPGGSATWQTFSVGRDARCDVVIDHPRVSRHHALIERHPCSASYVACDLGSRNGTRVDGVRLVHGRFRTLLSGSVIELGGLRLTFARPDELSAILSRTGNETWKR